jgi:hypothetical protein
LAALQDVVAAAADHHIVQRRRRGELHHLGRKAVGVEQAVDGFRLVDLHEGARAEPVTGHVASRPVSR